MSDDPSQLPPDHPWAKYYQEREKARPAMTRLQRATPKPANAPPAGGSPNQAGTPKSSVYDELQAAVTAVEQEVAAQTATFISAKQREELELAARRENRRKLLRIAVLGMAGVVALHFLVVNTLFRAPTTEKLAAVANQAGPEILRLYSSPEQPLELAGTHAEIRERLDSSTLSCTIAVTLRLLAPLVEPADSNGTAVYRSHAAAIPLVEAEAARRGLYPDGSAHLPPVMPRLLRTTHRAGETIVIRVPVTAHRFGWSWSFSAPEFLRRRASRLFVGSVLARSDSDAVLLIESPDSLARIRELTRQAKDYLEHIGRDLETLRLQDPTRSP